MHGRVQCDGLHRQGTRLGAVKLQAALAYMLDMVLFLSLGQAAWRPWSSSRLRRAAPQPSPAWQRTKTWAGDALHARRFTPSCCLHARHCMPCSCPCSAPLLLCGMPALYGEQDAPACLMPDWEPPSRAAVVP